VNKGLGIQHCHTKSGLTTPCLVETRQKAVRAAFSAGVGKEQKAEERKDFRQKGGYQGGFGIRPENRGSVFRPSLYGY
jgi:hypothetical protein